MIMEIGFAAGDIWQRLDKEPASKARFSRLASRLDLHRDMLFMSLGWLAREGYVILEPCGDDYDVSLRNY